MKVKKLLTKTQAHDLLEPYFQKLGRAYQMGMRDANKSMNAVQQGEFMHEFHPRLKATLLWNYVVNWSKNIFEDDPNVKILENSKAFGLLLYDSRLFLWFKKLDHNLRPKNNHTKRSRAMYGQRPNDLGIGDDRTFLVVGYRPDPTFSTIDGVYLVCSKSEKENHWEIDVSKSLPMDGELFIDHKEKSTTAIEELMQIRTEKLKAANE